MIDADEMIKLTVYIQVNILIKSLNEMIKLSIGK